MEISITPAGQLVIVAANDDAALLRPTDAVVEAALSSAFTQSLAEGLLSLVADALEAELAPGLLFWRQFACRCLHDLFLLGEEGLAQAVGAKRPTLPPPPDQETLRRLVDDAPPMRGMEYLTTDLLTKLWDDLQRLVLRRAAAHEEGAIAYLKQLNPVWNLLGRVTFHLAENKRNPALPFAFLATYAHRLSARAKLQHLPLGEALRQYAGEKNRELLAALLDPIQRAAARSPLVNDLLDSRALFQPQGWTIAQAHRFLVDVPVMEDAGLVVRVPDWWNARRPPRPEVQVKIGQAESSRVGTDGLLDFSVNLALDGQPLSQAEQQAVLAATDGLALLRGRWVEVDREKLQQALEHWGKVEKAHAQGIDFIDGMRMLAGVQWQESAESEQSEPWSAVVPGDWMKETLHKLRDPSGVVGCQPGERLKATLRPYQVDGVRWLWFMTRLGLGACLADDMGLGKTIQIIDLLLILQDALPSGPGPDKSSSADTPAPSLLVVPASLVGNWKSELQRFAPGLRVFYAHRSECDADGLEQVANHPIKRLAGFDAVVTTYGMLRRMTWLAKPHWRLVILDEAQAIKNASSAQAKAVRKLQASGRIALTGTPVENHLGELWSLLDFSCPGLLGNQQQFKRFVKRLQQRQDSDGYAGLRRLVRPYILRRLKTDPTVIADLPEKTEMRAECGLSRKQVAHYQHTLEAFEQRLKTSEAMQRRGLVLATLMQLKQICNHVSLHLKQPDFPPDESGKFQRLELICQPIIERQERILVFTQFQTMTDPLANFLQTVFGRPGLVLHGGIPVARRKNLVQTFQADDGPPFFVISVKAGGTGLNLTAASHVIHFDRWWNPAVENQATDRAFRIGQRKNVLVHKFVCRGTVEERIDEMIRSKQALADEVLGGDGETMLTEMSDRELIDFVAIDITRALADD